MRWIHEYQLFLFDFDGLLVNTEELHYLAYKKMCFERGFDFDWDFNRYCQTAHYHAKALCHEIYAKFPELQVLEPNWDVLYAEKKRFLIELLHQGGAQLMPGVTKLLQALQNANSKRCVVTHSPDDLVSVVRKQNPILDTIPFWITREAYAEPKPNPECYVKAIETLALPSDRIIGFEDTPRGLTALMGTRAKAVLICQASYPEIASFVQKGALHYTSLECIDFDWQGDSRGCSGGDVPGTPQQ